MNPPSDKDTVMFAENGDVRSLGSHEIAFLVRLEAKMNAISRELAEVKEDMEEMSEAIYDPDDGIYARVKDTHAAIDDLGKDLRAHMNDETNKLDTLISTKNSVKKFFKWIGVTVVGAALSAGAVILVKMLLGG